MPLTSDPGWDKHTDLSIEADHNRKPCVQSLVMRQQGNETVNSVYVQLFGRDTGVVSWQLAIVTASSGSFDASGTWRYILT